MFQKHFKNIDHVVTWSNVHVTWWMVSPTLSLLAIGVVEVQI